MSHPTEPPPTFTSTTIPAVKEVNGVYVVLEGVTPGTDVLMGGWGYLTWTGSVYHEAYDLNSMGGGDADLGALVVAPLDGVVTFVQWWDGRSSGFGSHLAMAVDDARAAAPCYLHVAHLNSIMAGVGQRVAAGQVLGTCGKSGNQSYAHVHAALWHEPPPGGWSFWQTGYSKEWVAAHTLDPQKWFWDSVARAGAMSSGGTPPEVIEMLLSGAQTAHVQAIMFGEYWRQTDPEFAIPTAWRERWHAGHWPGRALSAEQDIPPDPSEDKPAGKVQVFEHACAVWLEGCPVSWDG